MFRCIYAFVILLLVHSLHGQTATIKDPDGWTNVRKEPSINSEVVYKVNAGEFFFWVPPEFNRVDANSDWVEVYIPKNKYSLEDRNVTTPTLKGYIHRSRVLPTDSLIEYRGEDFQFEYLIEDFGPKGKFVEYRNEVPYAINGRQIYGNDVSNPGSQVSSIAVTFHGNPIYIHPIFFEDIYGCSNQFKLYKLGDCFIINQWNSDAGGRYEIVWVINSKGVKQRLVGTII